MNAKNLFLTTACLFSLVVVSTARATLPAREGSPVEAGKAVTVIRIGMTCEEVRKQLGRPAAVKPMEAPTGRAEVWTYRRPLGSTVRQTAARTHRLPSLGAPGSCQHDGMIEEPVFQLETRTADEVTQLLFFNGILVCSKRAVAEQRSFP